MFFSLCTRTLGYQIVEEYEIIVGCVWKVWIKSLDIIIVGCEIIVGCSTSNVKTNDNK